MPNQELKKKLRAFKRQLSMLLMMDAHALMPLQLVLAIQGCEKEFEEILPQIESMIEGNTGDAPPNPSDNLAQVESSADGELATTK